MAVGLHAPCMRCRPTFDRLSHVCRSRRPTPRMTSSADRLRPCNIGPFIERNHHDLPLHKLAHCTRCHCAVGLRHRGRRRAGAADRQSQGHGCTTRNLGTEGWGCNATPAAKHERRRWRKARRQRGADAGAHAKRQTAGQRHGGRIAVETSRRDNRQCRRAVRQGLGPSTAGAAIALTHRRLHQRPRWGARLKAPGARRPCRRWGMNNRVDSVGTDLHGIRSHRYSS